MENIDKKILGAGGENADGKLMIFGIPERHPKGWGYEDWIANGEQYCGKLLHFFKGKKFSIHYHKIKDETFYLNSGRLEVMLADTPEAYEHGEIQMAVMEPGSSLYIYPRRVHQVRALEESDMFEFSTHHEESDSYRIEKGD